MSKQQNTALLPQSRLSAALITAVLALAPVSSVRAQMAHDADAQAIRDNETQWNRDFETRDVDKLAAHYTADALVMGPGFTPKMGADAIRGMLKEMVADTALSLMFLSSRVEVAQGGDMAFCEGTYMMTFTNPATGKPMKDNGTYVTVYRKQADGSWKAVSDIASSGMPLGMMSTESR